VVFLNAGMLPRTGPYRFHVEYGRRLTIEGFDHLRLDQAQIGDSRARSAPVDPLERAFLDVGETLDALELKYGYRRFILFGICAGAQLGLLLAARDPRVCGVVLVDGPAFKTRSYHWSRFTNLFRPRRWRNIALRAWASIFRPRTYSPQLSNPPPWTLSHAEAEETLRSGLDRGVRYLWIHTGDSPMPFLSPRQFREAFPHQHSRKGLVFEWMPRATHLLTFRDDREDLYKSTLDWMRTVGEGRAP
jgi:pimeloyl-ACP methyl ester carboxylesterase